MKKGIIFLMLSIFLFCFMINNTVEAAPREVKMSGLYPPDYYLMQSFQRVADRITKETNGELKIVFYPAGQLGGYEQVFREVMRGTIEMQANYPTSVVNKKFDIGSMPGLARNWDDVKKLVTKGSPFEKFLEKTYDECGIKYIGSFLDCWMTGAIAKGKELKAPFDPNTNQGCVMRVVAIAAWRAWFRGMGYQVGFVPYAEVFSSLQTGIIDGDCGVSPESHYATLREVMGQFVDYRNVFVPSDFIINKKVWESFDKKTQDTIVRVFDEERINNFNAAKKSHVEYVQKIKEFGIKVVEPTPEESEVMFQVAKDKAWPVAYKALGKEVFKEIEDYLKK